MQAVNGPKREPNRPGRIFDAPPEPSKNMKILSPGAIAPAGGSGSDHGTRVDDPIMTLENGFNFADFFLLIQYLAIRPVGAGRIGVPGYF